MPSGLSRRQLLAGGAGLAAISMAGSGIARMVTAPARTMPTRPLMPLVFAHRGASALRPEHTLEAYALAIADGADFIEPDLVPTKDGVLVARHENNIAETTDVAAHPEFADRRTVKVVDGERQEGWFTEDFTLAELKTLRAKERLGLTRPQSMSVDGKFPIATFDEIVALVERDGGKAGRKVGLIPEIKHSTYFAGLGFDMEAKLVAAIRASAFLQSVPLIVQSFEVGNLKRLRREIGAMPNVQLMQLFDDDAARPADVVAAKGKLTYGQMATPQGFAAVAQYADWVAPQLRRLITLDAEGKTGPRTAFIADAHRADLLVGCYTFRPENQFLPVNYRYGGENERFEAGCVGDIRRYTTAGVDGFFTDDPRIGRLALTDWGQD
ncbi:glycerophosphodiester phosphodiesterase family protein [Novosphingobium sp. KCTC 2891]|uniref:glycerophosphodiester phosphodiesterase family protein n=1 Tax=Novosphingobium sp. KCTC 2891 TaxID=2989730 RepID=UPI002221E64A|nr:glycerophosphodiester phosphodiesterase family protein [Novosphingobium sp. KCTC 2891]MCW1384735.1 glycerophosphodiester phosphodiesterase family protein [Novosphingobium sp. KCTC 2891]